MAFLVTITCEKCHDDFQATVGAGSSGPKMCTACQVASDNLKRRQHFGRLDAMTNEERIREIEEWIYNYRPHKCSCEMRF